MKKVLKRITFYFLLLVVTIVTASAIATYLYQDELIDHFIREANKSLNTPIHVEEISVSPFENFPQVTLLFNDVVIEESYENSSYPLLEANKFEFTFNIWNLLEGQYIVEEVHITKAHCHLKVNEQGKINYNIIKAKGSKNKGKVAFNLSNVFLQEVDFKYSNENTSVNLDLKAEDASASLQVEGPQYNIDAKGLFFIESITVANRIWASEKDLNLEAAIIYHDSLKSVNYSSEDFKLSNSKFMVNGFYDFQDTPKIDLKVSGKNTDIQTLLSLLSAKNRARFEKYRSDGEVYFDLALKGEISTKKAPAINIDFGLKKCKLIYPDNDVAITGASAKGNFSSSDLSKPSTYALKLRETEGMLENRPFLANLNYTNFENPYLKLDLEGDFDIKSVFNFYELKELKQAKGDLLINMTFEGRLNDLKSKFGAGSFKTSGDILMKDISLSLNTLRLPLSGLKGNLLFNNSDIALSEVQGYLGSSHFKLNGFFKNILAYVFFENEPVGIESQLESDFINMDELLSSNGEASEESEYIFQLSPQLRLKFNCNVKQLQFRRLRAHRIIGNLKIKDKLALTDRLSFNTMGGKIDLAGLVDARNQKDIKVNTSFSLNNLNIDSIFYVFENFNQDFLEDRHLKGKVIAQVNASMDFNQNLDLFPKTLTSTISTTIQGGQLNRFEPLQRLDKYLDEDGLSKLEFSELKNDIFVENKTIYLPEMMVGSNVTDIRISGTHTFDQKINYRIVAPLRSKRKIDKDEAFGAIEESGSGKSRLYLKIIGSTSDYRVVYDKESVKKKIVSDLKKEVNELKKAFKNKGLKKEQTVELEEDDYFDWDDDGKL